MTDPSSWMRRPVTGWRAIGFDLDDTLYPERAFVLSGFGAVAGWIEAAVGLPGAGDRRAGQDPTRQARCPRAARLSPASGHPGRGRSGPLETRAMAAGAAG